jgi:hypothetical protein
MFEVRIYRWVDGNKVRTATIKNAKPFGFVHWCRLWFTLKKFSIDTKVRQ